MVTLVPSAFNDILFSFSYIFTAPSFNNFATLTINWILCRGRHSISRAIQAGGSHGLKKHHSVFYRFFSRVQWATDTAGQCLFNCFLPFLKEEMLLFIIDDTLCRKSGPHIWGAGMHHDPLNSTNGRGGVKRHTAFAYGHNWVILSVWIQFPWNPRRGVAIPIVFRFYQSKKRCAKEVYRKRTELAREMISVVRGWDFGEKRMMVTGDNEYACQTVVRNFPDDTHFTGPMLMTASIYKPLSFAPKKKKPRGSPRKKGKRLQNPGQIATNKSIPWQKASVTIYGRDIEIMTKSMLVVWYTVAGNRSVQMVITRDPKGRIEDRAYFSTDIGLEPAQILLVFSRRWTLEVTFFNCKQYLGLEDPQNGWGRAKKKKKKKVPGPQPYGNKGKKAVERTVPFIFLVYGIVHLWYFQNGSFEKDVLDVKKRAPWYRHKKEPSFADMLRAARRDIVTHLFMSDPDFKCIRHKLKPKIELLASDWLAWAA